MDIPTLPYSPPTVFVFALLALFASGALLSACDSDSDGAGNSLVGNYSLVDLEIEEEPVPSGEVDNAGLTLNDDDTWSGFLEADGSVISGEGRYSVSDQTVVFTLTDISANIDGQEDVIGITGEIDGDRLSILMRKDGGQDHSAVVERE